MSDGGNEAEIAAALGALRQALVTGVGPDETLDSSQLRDLVAGRLDPRVEAELLDRLGLPLDVRARLTELRGSPTAREIARRHVAGGPALSAAPGIDPLGVTAPPVYHLDGPHGGARPPGVGAEPVFRPGDRLELIARPAGAVSTPPPIALWAGLRDGPLRRVDDAVVQRDGSGVYRVLVPAERVFDAPGRWRLMLVLADEDMAPGRAETTESMVQVLRAWAIYDA